MREAELWKSMPDGAVSCFLCQRRCYLKEGEVGFCHVRQNVKGKLLTLNYGRCVSHAVDPIEKKPFYHFMPGSRAFSFAAPGCNFRCEHCQNWEISQPAKIFGQDIPPEQLVGMALRTASNGIAYTYTEPTIFFEYAKDTAVLARKKGLYNVFVSNGYMTPEAIKEMGFLDAARLDLKAFDDKFYKKICGEAHLEPVLQSIKLLHRKMHIEIITLLIPTLNDSDDEIRALSIWVRELDAKIPLHFTGYYPANRMTLPPTPVEALSRARKIALEEGLQYVYTGNRPGEEGESTFCPKCKEKVIERFGMEMVSNRLIDGDRCPECGTRLPIIFDWKELNEKKEA
ncbi:TPA: AmmeMemoRadiSam system radical SAM enzyme [Candidatus Micrarchaeota archaeon]|nr:AmmeMemoRadiSam system radical SAM enzyme [Candidatus Micrarchaeota archaeon]HIH30092.1 AmmeMemoRadiSam system radical SAM enzyme [Candidatus Micrarchaeota archaeon]